MKKRDDYAALVERAEGLRETSAKAYYEIDYYQRTKNNREIIDVLPELTAALKDCLSAAEQDRAAVRREALLEVARAVCWKCKAGKEVMLGIPYDSLNLTETYVHPTDGKHVLYLTCRASLLHEMLAADADQGREKEKKG